MFDLDFSDFLGAVRGREPLPWQSALASQVLMDGWPPSIGVATGLGKTTTIDMAVWALAREAHLAPTERRHPTRVWYVVDRRLLVDEASIQVSALAEMLRNPAAIVDPNRRAVIASAAKALGSRGIGDDGGPLFVSTMRGASPLGHRAPHAAKPAVMTTTVAMYASRLLFSGYGTSRGLAPIDAALAGTDCLVLLDEAHLSGALLQLLDRIGPCDASSAGILRLPGRFRAEPREVLPWARQRPRVVSLSATIAGGSTFDLTEADQHHPIVRQRLDAVKPTDLRVTTAKNAAPDMADRCVELLAEAPSARSALVFVNSPALARAVVKELTKHKSINTLLVTGQLRDFDADLSRNELLADVGGVRSGRKTEPEFPLVVVATQTLEVGADIDVDILVSELADQRAIIQRLGRLNRRGERPWARASLFHLSDEDSALYGDQIPAVVEALTRAGAQNGPIDLCPRRIASVVGAGAHVVPNTAELLPAHLFEWAKTSSYDPTVAPPELFFAGRDDNRATVSIAWRAHGTQGDELAPPLSDRETIDVSIADARRVVKDLANDSWARYDPTLKRLEKLDPDSVRPGMALVFAADVGGYSRKMGWDPDAKGVAVRDISPLVRRTLELNEITWANLVDRALLPSETALLASIIPADDDDPIDVEVAFDELWALLVEQNDSEPEADVEERAWAALRSSKPILTASASSVRVTWPNDSKRPQRVSVDAYDELSADAPALVTLHAHLRSVSATARRIANDVGLPDDLVRAVESAGRFHDLGKADLRFQAVLNNHDAVPLAKSILRAGQIRDRLNRSAVHGRWPAGSRHELLSAQLLDEALRNGLILDHQELVRHLVLSHHGHGRPSCPAPPGAVDRQTNYADDLRTWTSATNPSRADNEQPGRFRTLNETYGYWGLAMLEAIIRQADHVVSELTEVI